MHRCQKFSEVSDNVNVCRIGLCTSMVGSWLLVHRKCYLWRLLFKRTIIEKLLYTRVDSRVVWVNSLHPSVHVGVKLTNWYGMTCLNLIDHHTSYNNHLLGLKKFVKQHGTFCNTVILEKKVFIISKSSNKLICYMK